MDSLFWKMGPLKALVPAKAWQFSEGSDVQSRSVQVCACRSPSSQAMPNSAVAAPAQEISTASTDLPFNPLPLLSSRSSVPAPLKFLWFYRKNNRAPIEKRVPEQEYVVHLPAPEICEDTISMPLSTQSNAKALNALDNPQETVEKQEEDIWNESFLKECGDVALMQEMHLDSLVTPESMATVLSNAIMANVDPSPSNETMANVDPLCLPPRKSWLSRIADFKALWPNRKDQAGAPDASKTNITSSSEDIVSSIHSSKCVGTCEGCELNTSHGCSLEVPYKKVFHSKESFSKFLQNASLFDMKVLSQMSFLCDMAYMIPDIQPGQLLKHHHLRFITSSLDKKAEAEAKAKEVELLKKALRNDKDKLPSNADKGAGNSSEGSPSETNFITSGVEATAISSHASSCAQLNTKENGNASVAHTTNVSVEVGASAAFQTKLQQVENNTCTSDGEEELGPSDEESLMAVAPVTAVVVAEEETKLAVAKDLQASSSCPCEWFICDDPSMHTRFFVIQGSESLASWQANLLFEPTKFEGLDVLVHRGIYEAANALYEQVLPEVLAHFSTHGDLAQVRLTGHSLGGSLATLLALMFQIRGVLPRKSILPVVTFGSPCIMCGGDRLLQKMDLLPNHIQSIIMHRDVVPRAFSCDYPDHVAQILKRLNGKFRDHPCLNNQKLLYSPMGQLLILQPEGTTAPSHPLLPCGHGLYLLKHLTNEEGIERATELRAAQRAFLNMPHPLEILSDPGAYGLNGAISRDHNPCSYTKALHVVLKHEVKRLRRVQREQRRQLWWPLVIAESSLFAQRGLISSSTGDQISTNRDLTPAVCRSSTFFRQPVGNGTMINRIGFFAAGRSSFWASQKAAFSRYARLIASKHVQMGMLFIVSLRVVILECLSTLYVWI
eukprot:c24979_g1_i1 orf=178-2862(-)